MEGPQGALVEFDNLRKSAASQSGTALEEIERESRRPSTFPPLQDLDEKILVGF